MINCDSQDYQQIHHYHHCIIGIILKENLQEKEKKSYRVDGIPGHNSRTLKGVFQDSHCHQNHKHQHNYHCKLATSSPGKKPMLPSRGIFHCRLPVDKDCNFTMNLSSGDTQPIISSVALGPSALGQHWKLLASAHHLIKPHCSISRLWGLLGEDRGHLFQADHCCGS